MNDKTAQSMADELRLAAPSGDMAGLNGWGNLCNEAADTIDNLRAEKDRLMTCLEKANISTEHFEREWYLRGDELDNLRAQLDEVRKDAALEQALQQATMSLAELDMRDYFAAQAIGPLLRQIETYPDENWRMGIAIDAYAMADAMLAARERAPL